MMKLSIDVVYVDDFIKRQQVGAQIHIVAKPGFTLNADMNITPDARNIEAAGQHYFDKPPGTAQLGHYGNSDYPHFYGAGLVGYICQYEMATPTPTRKLMLDMQGLRLDEPLLERNGISLGARGVKGERCDYYDTRSPDIVRHFDHTLDSHQYQPIIDASHRPSDASPTRNTPEPDPQQKSQASPGFVSSGDALFDGLMKAAMSGDENQLSQAIKAVAESPFGQQFHQEVRAEVQAINAQQAQEQQQQEQQQQQQQEQAQQHSAPRMHR